MSLQELPPGWDEGRVQRVLAHYESQTESEAADEDEHAWAARFAATTEDQWTRLAEQARRDIASGKMMPLDKVFPSTTD